MIVQSARYVFRGIKGLALSAASRFLDSFPYRSIVPRKTVLLSDVTETVLDLDRSANRLFLRDTMRDKIAATAHLGYSVCFVSGDPFSVLAPVPPQTSYTFMPSL